MSQLYTSCGFLDDDPAVRVRRTPKHVHVEIDSLSVLLTVGTARLLRDKLNAADLDES